MSEQAFKVGQRVEARHPVYGGWLPATAIGSGGPEYPHVVDFDRDPLLAAHPDACFTDWCVRAHEIRPIATDRAAVRCDGDTPCSGLPVHPTRHAGIARCNEHVTRCSVCDGPTLGWHVPRCDGCEATYAAAKAVAARPEPATDGEYAIGARVEVVSPETMGKREAAWVPATVVDRTAYLWGVRLDGESSQCAPLWRHAQHMRQAEPIAYRRVTFYPPPVPSEDDVRQALREIARTPTLERAPWVVTDTLPIVAEDLTLRCPRCRGTLRKRGEVRVNFGLCGCSIGPIYRALPTWIDEHGDWHGTALDDERPSDIPPSCERVYETSCNHARGRHPLPEESVAEWRRDLARAQREADERHEAARGTTLYAGWAGTVAEAVGATEPTITVSWEGGGYVLGYAVEDSKPHPDGGHVVTVAIGGGDCTADGMRGWDDEMLRRVAGSLNADLNSAQYIADLGIECARRWPARAFDMFRVVAGDTADFGTVRIEVGEYGMWWSVAGESALATAERTIDLIRQIAGVA